MIIREKSINRKQGEIFEVVYTLIDDNNGIHHVGISGADLALTEAQQIDKVVAIVEAQAVVSEVVVLNTKVSS